MNVKRCAYCVNELDRKCQVKPKKPTVNLNKKRPHCELWEPDKEKIAEKMERMSQPEVFRRPEWFWLSKKQRKRLAELLEGAAPVAMPEESRIITPGEEGIITPGDEEGILWTPEDE